MPEDDIEETTELVLVAPNGVTARRVLTEGMQTANITEVQVDELEYREWPTPN